MAYNLRSTRLSTSAGRLLGGSNGKGRCAAGLEGRLTARAGERTEGCSVVALRSDAAPLVVRTPLLAGRAVDLTAVKRRRGKLPSVEILNGHNTFPPAAESERRLTTPELSTLSVCDSS